MGANLKPYKSFSISIEDNDSGKDLLENPLITFAALNVIYEPSLIPSCHLILTSSVGFPVDYYDIKNLAVTILIGGSTIKYNIGIDEMKTKDNKKELLEIDGFLCKYEDFNDISSAYLGGDLESAINALDIREKIVGADKVSQDYWQFQESKVQALIRILNQSAEGSIFTLSNDKIIVKKLSESTDSKDEIMWNEIDYFYRNQKIKDLIESKTNIVNFEDESSGLKMYSAFGKTIIDTIDNDTSLLNQASSEAYRKFPADTMLKLHYSKLVFPYDIGDSMNIKSTVLYNGSELFIISKIVSYSAFDYYTDVIMISKALSE